LGDGDGCQTDSLERWRSEGIGPKFLKHCGRVLYRQVDIEAYEESCLATSTKTLAVQNGAGGAGPQACAARCESRIGIWQYRLLYAPSENPRKIRLKKFALLALVLSAAAPSAFAGSNVAVSIGVNEPGVYGRINIGNAPPPVLVSPQPVLIAPAPVAVVQQPVYLYVPEEHQKNWRHYCGRYNACGQPVYFVKEQWVRDRYREHEHEHERHERYRDDEDHDHRREHERGHGHDND